MVLRDPKDPLAQSRGIMGPLGDSAVQNNRGRLRQRFDLIRKLGQGTYGKVQLGIDKETGQEVAIKTIKKSKIETEADLIRIRREIQIMSSVRHPNIIHIYEVFENREKMVLVMEYAAGGELYDYLSERKVLPEDEARRIFRQIASAVYYCHKHKICHRDLKLENILLDEKNNAKIADFGLSNVFDDVNLLKTFCGSPLYASPEIVRGTPYYGPEVDCWSLGVLLYTLVYGAMPFDGSNFKRLVKQISHGEYYEPKKPAEATLLIRRMLTVDPLKRASIKEVCAHQWINEGFDKPCLASAEEIANQTPVRLDVLLSVAPGHINHSQVVIACGNNEADGLESESTQAESSLKQKGDHAKTTEPAQKEPHATKDKPSPAAAKTKQSPQDAKKGTQAKGSAEKDVKRKAAVKKKSKSSPVLELIVDEEEEVEKGVLEVIKADENEDADDGADTLSEISEIQTLAEDGNDAVKTKSKTQIEREAPKMREKSQPPKQVEATEPQPTEETIQQAKSTPKVPLRPDKLQTESKPVTEVEKVEKAPEVHAAPKVEAESKTKVAEKKPDVSEEQAAAEKQPVPVKVKPTEKAEPQAEKKEEKTAKASKREETGAATTSKPPAVKKKVVRKVVKDAADKEKTSEPESNEKNRSTSKSNATVSTGSSSSVASSADKAESGESSGPKGIKLRGRSDSNSSDPSPTRIERRNSKVISQKTAELIQNLETKASNSSGEKVKKLVFPSVKVSDAKRAFEKPPKVVKESPPKSTPEKQTPEKTNTSESKKTIEPESTATTAGDGTASKSQRSPKVSKKTTAPSAKPAEKDGPSVISAETSAAGTPGGTTANAPATTKGEPKAVVPQKSSEKVPRNQVTPAPTSDLPQEPVKVIAQEPTAAGPVKKQAAKGLTKLKMPEVQQAEVPPADQQMKPVLVDSGTGTPKQAVMLVAGRTTPPVKSGGETDSAATSTAEPFFSSTESVSRTIPVENAKASSAKPSKEQAAKKISAVISRIASSESTERILREPKEKPVKIVKTEVSFPVAAAPSKERVIPIKFEDDVVPSTPPAQVQAAQARGVITSSKTQSAPNITRLPSKMDRTGTTSTMSTLSRQNSSDTESSLAPPHRLEPIRKSPREFIIPIKLEASGQTLTPKEDTSEASHAEDPFRADSRLRSGRFGRHKRYSSLLSDSSLEDEPAAVSQSAGTSRRSSTTAPTPCHARSHSQGDEPDTPEAPLSVFKRYRTKRGSGTPLDRSDSFSSAEEDEEDAFEVLTAESLFSSLLDRVRNLTKRLNRDEEGTTSWSTGPDSPSLANWVAGNPFREFMSRASSESRPVSTAASGEFRMRRSYSREPSVTVTISTGPTWRSNLSRQTSRESDTGSATCESQSSVTTVPINTAGCSSTGMYPYRGYAIQQLDSDTNSLAGSLSSSFARSRRTPLSHCSSDPFGPGDAAASGSTYPYHQPSSTIRPYGRSLSNTDYNIAPITRTLPLRRSLNSRSRYEPPNNLSSDSPSSTLLGSSTGSSFSSYYSPARGEGATAGGRYDGFSSGSSAYPTVQPTFSRFRRSLSSAPTGASDIIGSNMNSETRRGHSDFSSPYDLSRSGESNGWVGGQNSSSIASTIDRVPSFRRLRGTGENDSHMSLSRLSSPSGSVSGRTSNPAGQSGGLSPSQNLEINGNSGIRSRASLPRTVTSEVASTEEATRQEPGLPAFRSKIGQSAGREVEVAPIGSETSLERDREPVPSNDRHTEGARKPWNSSVGLRALRVVTPAAPDENKIVVSSPPTLSSPATSIPRRDSRAQSVEKITRILERMSLPKESAPSPEAPVKLPESGNQRGTAAKLSTENNREAVISPTTSKSPAEDTQTEAHGNNNQARTSNTKGTKSRFMQSLEKKWEKLTSPIGNGLSEKIESPSQEEEISVSNLDRESVLLQRAVSPEKKTKSKSGNSTVGFMLGKFRKIEESTSKIPTGGSSVTTNKSPRRVTSPYAGAASDSVLTLSQSTQPRTSENKSPILRKLSKVVSPSSATKNINPSENSTLHSETNTEEKGVVLPEMISATGTEEAAQPHLKSSLPGSMSFVSKRLSSVGSLIPRLNTKLPTPSVETDTDIMIATNHEQLKAPTLLSRGSTPTPVSPRIHVTLDDGDCEENATTANSDSLESSSVCSEKTEISGRSVLDEEESVSDRIFRKSFYPRFNSLDRKKPSSGRYYSSSPSKGVKPPGRSSTSPIGSLERSKEMTASTSNKKKTGSSFSGPAPLSAPPLILNDTINKYNPNPLFKELITDEFQTEVGNKADYSRRVTNKLSKLLQEIESDAANSIGGGKQSNNKDVTLPVANENLKGRQTDAT